MNVVRPTRLLCRLSAPGQNSATAGIVMAVVVVGVLYFARDVLVPIVLAVLMSFVLAPLIALLQRLRCPQSWQSSSSSLRPSVSYSRSVD